MSGFSVLPTAATATTTTTVSTAATSSFEDFGETDLLNKCSTTPTPTTTATTSKPKPTEIAKNKCAGLAPATFSATFNSSSGGSSADIDVHQKKSASPKPSQVFLVAAGLAETNKSFKKRQCGFLAYTTEEKAIAAVIRTKGIDFREEFKMRFGSPFIEVESDSLTKNQLAQFGFNSEEAGDPTKVYLCVGNHGCLGQGWEVTGVYSSEAESNYWARNQSLNECCCADQSVSVELGIDDDIPIFPKDHYLWKEKYWN